MRSSPVLPSILKDLQEELLIDWRGNEGEIKVEPLDE